MAVDYSQAEKDREMIIRMRQRATARSFERMRAKIDEQIATMNMSTVSERAKRQQLEEIRNELQKALGTFYGDLEDGLKSDMVSIGESVLSDSEAFYKSLNMPISMSITSFPVEIMENVINGTVYKERWFLSSALWGDYQSKLDDINTVVAEGIGLNKSIYDIAKDLEKYVDPNARKDWSWAKVYPGTAKTVDYNAQRLARTLVSHAYQQNVVRQAQANPFASGVKWEASGGERMCEICEERDGKIFPVDDVPLDHPNGMCTFSVETPSMMEMSDILADWVNGDPTPYDDQLNAYYEGIPIEHKSTANTASKKDEEMHRPKVGKTIYDEYAEDLSRKREMLEGILNDKFVKDIPDEFRGTIVDVIKNLPDEYKELLSKTIGNVNIRWLNEEGTSHYTYGSGQIEMFYKRFGENRDVNDVVRAFWHEFGHYIDDAKVSGSGFGWIEEIAVRNGKAMTFDWYGIYQQAMKDKAYQHAAANDINAFLQRFGLDDKYYCSVGESYQWMYDTYGNPIDTTNMSFDVNKELHHALQTWLDDFTGMRKARDYLYEQGYPKQPEYNNYFVSYRTPKRQTLKWKERYKGAGEDYIAANQKYYDLIDKFRAEHDMDKLTAEQSKLEKLALEKESAVGWVTDTFDAGAWGAFSSIISGGHSADYYLRNDNGVRESVANVFMSEFTRDKDVEDGLRDLCPNVYALIGGIIGD